LPPLDALMAMGPDMAMMGPHHFRAPDPEKRAQRLRDVLQLRPDQDGALKAFVEATSPKVTMVRKEEAKDGAKMEPPTTLERLDRMAKAADAMKARAEATRTFYLALTPSQQKTFDVLGMDGRDGGGVYVHRFDTRGPDVFKSGDRKVIIQRKVG
uniref:Spy/CpxP family protein refolding chaperone n=1 Tax=uncultured Caulobacter sp. TaxID=158749 RepID=UPI0025F4EF9C